MRLDEEMLGPVSVLAEPPLQKVVAPCAQWRPIPASLHRCLPEASEGGESKEEKKE